MALTPQSAITVTRDFTETIRPEGARGNGHTTPLPCVRVFGVCGGVAYMQHTVTDPSVENFSVQFRQMNVVGTGKGTGSGELIYP